jgi:hypothetical protein
MPIHRRCAEHLSFVICHLSLVEPRFFNDKLKMNNEQWKMIRVLCASAVSEAFSTNQSKLTRCLVAVKMWS